MRRRGNARKDRRLQLRPLPPGAERRGGVLVQAPESGLGHAHETGRPRRDCWLTQPDSGSPEGSFTASER